MRLDLQLRTVAYAVDGQVHVSAIPSCNVLSFKGNSVAISSDGSRALVACDAKCRIWDLETATCILEFPSSRALAWSLDGRRIATSDSIVSLRDMKSVKLPVRANDIKFSPCHSQVLLGDDEGIKTIDERIGVLGSSPIPGVTHVSYSGDAMFIMATGRNSTDVFRARTMGDAVYSSHHWFSSFDQNGKIVFIDEGRAYIDTISNRGPTEIRPINCDGPIDDPPCFSHDLMALLDVGLEVLVYRDYNCVWSHLPGTRAHSYMDIRPHRRPRRH